MGLNISVGIQVEAPDGTKFLQVMRADTALNPNPDDPEAEILVAVQMMDRLVDEARASAAERLDEYRRFILKDA